VVPGSRPWPVVLNALFRPYRKRLGAGLARRVLRSGAKARVEMEDWQRSAPSQRRRTKPIVMLAPDSRKVSNACWALHGVLPRGIGRWAARSPQSSTASGVGGRDALVGCVLLRQWWSERFSEKRYTSSILVGGMLVRPLPSREQRPKSPSDPGGRWGHLVAPGVLAERDDVGRVVVADAASRPGAAARR